MVSFVVVLLSRFISKMDAVILADVVGCCCRQIWLVPVSVRVGDGVDVLLVGNQLGSLVVVAIDFVTVYDVNIDDSIGITVDDSLCRFVAICLSNGFGVRVDGVGCS